MRSPTCVSAPLLLALGAAIASAGVAASPSVASTGLIAGRSASGPIWFPGQLSVQSVGTQQPSGALADPLCNARPGGFNCRLAVGSLDAAMILLRAAFTDSDGVFYNYSDEYSYRLLFRDVLVADRRRRDVYHLSVVRPCPTCDHLTGMSATRLDLSGGVPRLYSEVSTFVRPALLDGVGCLMKGRLRFTADLTDVFRFLESEAVPCTKRKQELIAMLPPMITISVIENGTRRPAPSALRVTVDGRTLDVPAMESTFEFPDEVVASGEVLVEADLGDEILRIPRIHGSFFRQMDWTIRLGNRADAESYDWPTEIKVPKLSSTCMIDFNAAGMDPGRQMSVTSCRRPKR